MNDEDIRALRPLDAAAPLRSRRVWPWVLGGVLLLSLLALAAGVAALGTLADGMRDGWHVVLNGEPWDFGDGFSIGTGDGLWALLGVGLALLAALVVVPLVVVFALLLVGLIVALVLGITLGSVGLVFLVLFSPLWLGLLLLWLLLRRKPSPPAARMGA